MCESIKGCTCGQTIKTLESALTETSECLDYLISFFNNSEVIQECLREFGISSAFLAINQTCGRPDRNAEHLKKAWGKLFEEAKQDCAVDYDEFCLEMEYKLISIMPQDDVDHYANLLGYKSNKLRDHVKAILLYQEDYHILQHHDGTFVLTIGNQEWTAESYTGANFEEMQWDLYQYYKGEVNHG